MHNLPTSGLACVWGFRPRARLSLLAQLVYQQVIARPLFLFLVVSAVVAGVLNAGVLTSLLMGSQQVIDSAASQGSRLTRVDIQPRPIDRLAEERFPTRAEIAAWPAVTAVTPRRETTVYLEDNTGRYAPHQAPGLQPNDPEYRLLQFTAGRQFSGSDALEAIVSESLLHQLFDTADLVAGRVGIDHYLGRAITVRLQLINKNGAVLGEAFPMLSVVGVVAQGEAGRQIYLPNTTLMVFDQWRRLREGALPITEDRRQWSMPAAELAAYAAFPWEDRLQVYVRTLPDVIPTFRALSRLGYQPRSDIFNYSWAQDARDITTLIFLPLLALATVVAAVTIGGNVSTTGRLLQKQFALQRILGLRVGDIAAVLLLSVSAMVLLGVLLGEALAAVLLRLGRTHLLTTYPDQPYHHLLAPLGPGHFLAIGGVALAIGLAAALRPILRIASANPGSLLDRD